MLAVDFLELLRGGLVILALIHQVQALRVELIRQYCGEGVVTLRRWTLRHSKLVPHPLSGIASAIRPAASRSDRGSDPITCQMKCVVRASYAIPTWKMMGRLWVRLVTEPARAMDRGHGRQTPPPVVAVSCNRRPV